MSRLRCVVQRTIQEGTGSSCAQTAATCFEVFKLDEGLWTFACVRGVEPANNAAEPALRHAVIWRRVSGGTAGVQGSRFVERMRTVAATSRQQSRRVLTYLTSCFEAARRGHAIPSLLPADTSAVKVA